MKKIVLLCLIVIQLFSEEAFWYDSYTEAIEASQEEHKPMLVFVSQFGCKACAYMEDEVLFKEDIATYLDTNYIAVHIDMREKTTPKRFKTGMTPTFFFLDEDEKELLDMIVGATDHDEFLAELKEALEK